MQAHNELCTCTPAPQCSRPSMQIHGANTGTYVFQSKREQTSSKVLKATGKKRASRRRADCHLLCKTHSKGTNSKCHSTLDRTFHTALAGHRTALKQARIGQHAMQIPSRMKPRKGKPQPVGQSKKKHVDQRGHATSASRSHRPATASFLPHPVGDGMPTEATFQLQTCRACQPSMHTWVHVRIFPTFYRNCKQCESRQGLY